MTVIQFMPCRECKRVMGPQEQRGAKGRWAGLCLTCREFDRQLRQMAARLKRAGEQRRRAAREVEAARERQAALCKEQLALMKRRREYIASMHPTASRRAGQAGERAA